METFRYDTENKAFVRVTHEGITSVVVPASILGPDIAIQPFNKDLAPVDEIKELKAHVASLLEDVSKLKSKIKV